MTIYPAILSGDMNVVCQQLEAISQFPECDVVHIDIIDGFFVDNHTVGPADLAEANFGELQCDVHLMAIDPEDLVNELVEYKETVPIRTIIAQVEKMGSEQSFVDAVKRQEWQVGLALDVDSAVESIDDTIWSQLQVVQVMGVQAGLQGQSFIPRTLALVDELVQLRKRDGLDFMLAIDGGIKADLLAQLRTHQLDSATIGSFLWHSEDPLSQWLAMQEEA